MNIRYFLLNLGGAIGPLLGVTIGLSSPQHLFYITGITYLLYTCWLFLALSASRRLVSPILPTAEFSRHPQSHQP